MLKRIKKIIFAPQTIAIVMCVIFAVCGILINLNRFWQYESGYYDFGIFDRAIWSAAHFKLPIIDHFAFSGKVIFADHFNPSIFLLSPIYWITSRSEALFIVQDILVGLSGYVLYRIGIVVLKDEVTSLIILMAYFLFVGLQNAIFSDVHEVTLMTFFLMVTYWALFKNKWNVYFLFLLITLGFKESLFLLGIGLSLFVLLMKKEWRLIGIYTFIISVVWGIASIQFIIPYFSGGIYYYSPPVLNGPMDLVTHFLLPIIKVKTMVITLASFLFLPLLTPQMWPLFLFHYLQRFLLASSTRWDLGLHYNAEIAPSLAIATIVALSYLQNRLSTKLFRLITIILIIVSFVLYRFILHGPYGLAYNPVFYQHTKDFEYLNKLITKIPQNSTVAAQNNIASRFLHNKNIWILRENYAQFNADYILFDLRPGQNPTNFLGAKDINSVFASVSKDSDYHLMFHEGDQYIFKRR